MTAGLALDTRVRVSWSGSGTMTDPYDDVTGHVAGEPGLTLDLGKDGARTLDPPKVSAIDFELHNETGLYSQERATSPLYQQIVPGRPVDVVISLGETDVYTSATRYTAADFYDGVASYTAASGAVDEISQTIEYGQQRVRLGCLGLEATLVSGTVTVGVMTAPRVDECITALLDAVGWPMAQRDISVSDSTLLYWWCDDRVPWDALMELVRSEGSGATVYLNGETLHFENRNYRTTATRSTEIQATFFDTGLNAASAVLAYNAAEAYTSEDLYNGQTSGLWFTSLSYDPGFRVIRNAARYTTRQRTLGALAVVWSYGADLVLTPGQTITLIARPSNPFQNAVTPNIIDGDYTVAGGTISVGLSATSGLVAFLTITATSGAPTISGLRLRAQPLTASSDTTVQNSVDASESITKFSPIPGVDIPRVLDVGGWPEIGVPFAEAVCDSWVSRYQIQRPAVTITLEAADELHIRQMLDRQVSDRIQLSSSLTGISADVWVNSKHLTISGGGGRRLVCLLGCEKVEEIFGSGGAIWDGPDEPENQWNTGLWGV
jgi:hypothetical protein